MVSGMEEVRLRPVGASSLLQRRGLSPPASKADSAAQTQSVARIPASILAFFSRARGRKEVWRWI